jgi:DNA-binding Xre family transcriptional regulator
MEERADTLRCYSRLWKILSERHMTVAELGRALAGRGVRVNVKTLYRLADPTAPIERLDMGVAGEICKVLTVDLSHLVSFEAARRDAGLRRIAPARQRRLDWLLDRQAAGRLTGPERRELSELVEEAERLTLQNARTLARARHAAVRT